MLKCSLNERVDEYFLLNCLCLDHVLSQIILFVKVGIVPLCYYFLSLNYKSLDPCGKFLYCTEMDSSPVLLRNNWHTSLNRFKAYSMMVWLTYIVKWLPQYVQLTSIFSHRYNKKKRKKKTIKENIFFSPCDENSGFLNCLNKLPIIYHTAILAIVIMYIISLVLKKWKIGGPY